MQDKIPPSIKPFEESIGILFEELKLAINWERPSLLFALIKSRPGQTRAAGALGVRLAGLGQKIVELQINEKSSNAAHQILQTKESGNKSIYFISNFEQDGKSGKDAYTALNLYRELFVEHRIRAVFWLTKNEEMNLPRYAPDFWAFRHRVVEFANTRQRDDEKPPIGILMWNIPSFNDSPAEAKEKIASLEKILRELPNTIESLSTRLELLYELGYLHWLLGYPEKAKGILTDGLQHAAHREVFHLKARLLDGLAIIYYEMEEYQKALEICASRIEDDPRDSRVLLNLAAVLCALGKNSEAVLKMRKAIQMEPSNARLWHSVGHVYLAMGKLTEASACFKKALEIAPAVASHYESLGMCLSRMNLRDEALEQINRARKFREDQTLSNIFEEAVLNNTKATADAIKAALTTRKLTQMHLHLDPNLRIILDDIRIQALVQLAPGSRPSK